MTTLSSLAATIAADASNSSTTTGYYLPFVILSQPLSLDPMQVGDLTLGPLATISASLQGTLCSTLQSHATAAPNSAPVLQLTDAVLSGLSNAVGRRR